MILLFFKLYKNAPDYSFLPNFGCRCYPLLRPYAENKLSYRSIPCIFIGYCSGQKGYRRLDSISECVYISRSVVFDENYFPAKIKIPNHSPVGVMIPPGMSSSPLQIPISLNFLGSPPTRSTGTSSSPLPIPTSPKFLGSPPTYWINSSTDQPATTSHPLPQPHEPLDSPVSLISSFI